MRIRWLLLSLSLLFSALPARAAKPVFENQTPAGFSPEDSTAQSSFVAGAEVSVRVDLNQAATYEYPVVGHFHELERSEQIGSTDTDGMQVDIAVVPVAPFGTHTDQPEPGDTTGTIQPVVHMAWIEQTSSIPRGTFPYTGGSTPVYRVMYARSFDGGATFSTPVSVCGEITYHALTANGSGASFSTLDLEVDSGGHPRVVYAMVSTADRTRSKNVYFAYSQDGGGTWQTPVRVNNLSQAEGRNCAFPRMAIDDRDEIFIAYVRGASRGSGSDDVMLAKVNRETSPFSILPIGEDGTAGSGGIRLTPDGDRQTGPDLAIGDGDALHLIYFDDADDRIEHKRMATDTTWVEVGASGWNQDADGATVASFVDEPAGNAALETEARYYFPTIVVDRQRDPDRVYALFKYGDNTPVEGIYFNQYDDDGTTGTGITWGTASPVWKSSGPALFADGSGQYNVELDWEITERVAAVVEQRLEDRGDLHIAFTAGYSGGGEHDVYYAWYDGTSWTLPEKVADDDSDGAGTEDGIASTDVFLLSPALACHPDEQNLFLAFAGGTGEGFGLGGVTDVNHHAYFKVLGRDITWEDQSVPAGGYQYTLSYTPVNPHTTASSDQAVYVHVADPTDGSGLGARADSSDGFLAGDWESVGTYTLADDDKYFEGRVDEDPSSDHEWGDDDDKVGLLVKLNVLGSDSATNLQVVTSSTASGAGTGLGARCVRVGNATGSFVGTGSFFLLGADIDIVDSNNAPQVRITEPDGSGDEANTSYTIHYSLTDADDDLSAGSLKAALYAYPTNGLRTVQEIRIFGTLIADENDDPNVNANGTGDFSEGTNQTYTWDDPPDALESSALFASILHMKSGQYYLYLVADDQKNPPVFAVSPGPVTLRHGPIVQQVDPIDADTVDTGVRTGLKANPYDLDFRVIDYDSEARVQLFYSSVSGLTSVSAIGTYPNQRFVLGKSVSGTRGVAITDSTTLTSRDTEYSWDLTSPLVPEGSYYLYAVATDSVSVAVGQSTRPLVVEHSPSFVFYEPARDTQRWIDTGSQPVYTIQWQKGPGDQDLDDDATIDLYFTTDDPAVSEHATDLGASPTSLLSDPDTRLIVSGLKEDGDGASDMYAWDLRNPPNDVPVSGQRVWIYAVLTDAHGNVSVARGGSVVFEHSPSILLETRMPSINQGDVIRLEWDDYLVDDGSGTDDAYIRLYAAPSPDHATLQSLEAGVSAGTAYLVNSSDGTSSGSITPIREDSSDAFNWDTRTAGFTLPEGEYWVYAGISKDPTFSDNTTGRISRSSNLLTVGAGTGITPNLSLSPSKVSASIGDTLTFEVWVQSGGQTLESISLAIDLKGADLLVLNSLSPFTDLGEVFSGGTVVENSTSDNVLRFTKIKVGGEVVGSEDEQKRLVRFQVRVESGFSGRVELAFDDDETALGISGSATPLKKGTGLAAQNAQVQSVPRGRILATVLLEGRSAPLGNGDHSTLLDVHLRLPGSTFDLEDDRFRLANDDYPSTSDTVEVQTASDGGLTLTSIPAGRYVLTVKDSSHLSGRTDTLVIRPGETVVLSSEHGFFASDIRGDPSFLLDQDGRQLKAGDATGDNEIDEDDINAIDAAWGTDEGAANFAWADLNNDGRVGIEDLTVASSNIGNSTGFGAPPVYKPVAQCNAQAWVGLRAPGHPGEWRKGEEIELVFEGGDLDDLAGYSLDLEYDPLEVELIGGTAQVGGIFRNAPSGSFGRIEQEEGRLSVASARRGKGWAGSGKGELLRVRARLLRDGFPRSVRLREGRLISSWYETATVQLLRGAEDLALPRRFVLEQNFPNPFNPSTTIPFTVPALGLGEVPVSVEIFDLLGQRIRLLLDGRLRPGSYQMVWDGCDQGGRSAGSGIYLYRVRVGTAEQVRRMTLVK